MANRPTITRRFVAALLVAALLALAGPARADDTGAVGETSKLQYVGRAVLVVGAALILFVVIRAVLNKPDETTRLAAATAKLDRAMELRPAGASGKAPELDVGLRRGRSWRLPDARAAAPARISTPTSSRP